MLAKVMVFKGALAKSASVVMMGNGHFVESHKVDQKKSVVDHFVKRYLCRFGMLPMADYHATNGVLAMDTTACWG